MTAEIEAVAAGNGAPLIIAEARLRDGTTQRAVIEAVAGPGVAPTAMPETPTEMPTETPTAPTPTHALYIPTAMR